MSHPLRIGTILHCETRFYIVTALTPVQVVIVRLGTIQTPEGIVPDPLDPRPNPLGDSRKKPREDGSISMTRYTHKRLPTDLQVWDGSPQ